MALITKQKKDFTIKIKDPREHGDNIVFIKGGSVVIEGIWVFFSDLRIDVQKTVLDYVNSTSRRIFNGFNDILYVLFVMNSAGKIEVLPSASFNKNSFGDVKVFPTLTGKLPLVLIKLTQDGSSNLKSFIPIQPEDIELYQGYGNYTLMGPKGEKGFKGITGMSGITGFQGITGKQGNYGKNGETGIPGMTIQGITGIVGIDGANVPAFIIDR